MNTLRFEENKHIQIALKYPSGKHVEGKFGEQVMYSLQSGEVMYVPLIVEKKLQELKAKPGEALQITKAKPNGKVEWQVQRIARPQLVTKLLDNVPLEDFPETANIPRKPPTTQLANALKTALTAAKEAEAYSEEIGHPIRFDKDDIRLMAQTLVINASKERAA